MSQNAIIALLALGGIGLYVYSKKKSVPSDPVAAQAALNNTLVGANPTAFAGSTNTNSGRGVDSGTQYGPATPEGGSGDDVTYANLGGTLVQNPDYNAVSGDTNP